MMDTIFEYEEFAQNLMNQLQARTMPEFVQIRMGKAQKVNQTLDAIIVQFADSDAAPCIYIAPKYQMYLSGYPMETIVEDTVDEIQDVTDRVYQIPEITPESAKHSLYCAIVNTERNQEMLEDIPHRQFEDLSLIVRYRIDDAMSFVVSNSLCSMIQMTPDEIMDLAMKNTESMPFQYKKLQDTIAEQYRLAGMPEDFIAEHTVYYDNLAVHYLSNESGIDGAVLMASKPALQKVYEQMGQDYFIVPSSRHEVLILPKDLLDQENIAEMIRDINQELLPPWDYLSDHLYLYDSRTQSVHIADAITQAQEPGIPTQLSDQIQTKGHTH